MSEREKFEVDRKEGHLDWRFVSSNLGNSSLGLISKENSMNLSRGDLMGSSSYSDMVDSYCSNFLDLLTNSENFGGLHRTLGMSWNIGSSMMKKDGVLPNGPQILSQGLSQFPTDSGFMDAARMSCFSAGSFGDMLNSCGPTFGARNAFYGNGLKSAHGRGPSQECGLKLVEVATDVSKSVEDFGTEGSSLRYDKRSDCPMMSPDEGKQTLGISCNEADGAESSGDDGSQMLDCSSGEASIKSLNLKKRKRSGQDGDIDKATRTLELPTKTAKGNCISREKGEKPPTSTTKASGKNAKQGSQASDPPSEGYMHVRARCGQATNSHSLVERVRREKISERIKFLQDLVPGCSKVTGKAVILDEIINYVQSLQQQVEFLSMKLATVNSQADYNIEGLFPKNHRLGLSFTPGFLTEMPMAFPPLLHPSQPGPICSSLPSMKNSSDILGQTVEPQLTPLTGGYKESDQVNPLQAAKH